MRERKGEPRHTVVLAVVVTFEGDYYGTDELVGVCDHWIGSAFDDRDDLRGYTLTGVAMRDPDAHEGD